jgi:hypothetical protein
LVVEIIIPRELHICSRRPKPRVESHTKGNNGEYA